MKKPKKFYRIRSGSIAEVLAIVIAAIAIAGIIAYIKLYALMN